MPRIAKADVNAALSTAAKAILTAGGPDGRVSRAEVNKALPALPKERRKLVDMFFRFIDNRDFKSGAQVTRADLTRAVDYAKKHMVAKYDLNSDGLSRDEISRMSLTGKLAVDLARELKKAGSVDLPTGPVSVTDRVATAAIEAAITHDGADQKLTKEVKLAEVPVAVRDALKKAGKEITDASNDDYSADVEGYFAVFKSATDKTIVGYAVKGSGTGEPDYQDSFIKGFNLAGKRLVDEREDW